MPPHLRVGAEEEHAEVASRSCVGSEQGLQDLDLRLRVLAVPLTRVLGVFLAIAAVQFKLAPTALSSASKMPLSERELWCRMISRSSGSMLYTISVTSLTSEIAAAMSSSYSACVPREVAWLRDAVCLPRPTLRSTALPRLRH